MCVFYEYSIRSAHVRIYLRKNVWNEIIACSRLRPHDGSCGNITEWIFLPYLLLNNGDIFAAETLIRDVPAESLSRSNRDRTSRLTHSLSDDPQLGFANRGVGRRRFCENILARRYTRPIAGIFHRAVLEGNVRKRAREKTRAGFGGARGRKCAHRYPIQVDK